MSKLKAGDKIIMLKGSDSSEFCASGETVTVYYYAGDVAVLTHQDEDDDWYADFNGQGNKMVSGTGFWCVGAQHEHRPDWKMFDLVKSN